MTVEDTHRGRSAAGTMAATEMELHLYQTSEPIPALSPVSLRALSEFDTISSVKDNAVRILKTSHKPILLSKSYRYFM